MGPRIIEALIFLCGRLFAYLVLGYLAGLSAANTPEIRYFGFYYISKTFRRGIIIVLGILDSVCQRAGFLRSQIQRSKVFTFSSLLTLGFIMGISPCAPLLALLFEIQLYLKRRFRFTLRFFIRIRHIYFRFYYNLRIIKV